MVIKWNPGLELNQIEKAVSILKKIGIQNKLAITKLAIVNEGLLSYLTREEKLILAKNIRHVLLSTGEGVWITTGYNNTTYYHKILLVYKLPGYLISRS
jgi:hypothetical protein